VVAQRLQQGGDPLGRDAVPHRPRGRGGQVEAAVEALEELDLVIAEAPEHDTDGRVEPELHLPVATAQRPELLLQARSGDHRPPPRGPDQVGCVVSRQSRTNR
jgi:hypothetical protein